jgi:hypothetical protein
VLTIAALIPLALSVAAAVCFALRKWNLGAMFLTLVLSAFLAGGVLLAFSGDYLINQITQDPSPEPFPTYDPNTFTPDEDFVPPDPTLNPECATPGAETNPACPHD